VSVYEGSLQSAKLRDQEQLVLSAPVPTTAEFVMGDTVDFDSGYRNAAVYFGEFFSGSTRDLKLHARSNAGYRVTLRSYNASKMRNLDLRERDEIAYTLSIDGASVSLADGTTVTAMQRSGTTPGLGNEHNLRFRVGDLGNAGAGTYIDVIQVTLYPSR
jgi:spore coat protein U-like protein